MGIEQELPSDWSAQSIQECMSAIIDYRGKTPQKTSFGVPLITAKIVKGGRIMPPEEFIAESDYVAWMRRGMPKPGDVVVTTEAPLGEVAQLDDRKIALAQRLIGLRGKPDRLDNTFLRFAMQSAIVQDQLSARSSGTTVHGIRQKELRHVEIPLPPLPEQRAIARVLGGLDDKIELNRRMNRTLEDLARGLFRSWFVDFDPVVKGASATAPAAPNPRVASPGGGLPIAQPLWPKRLIDSPLGPIPEGWRVVPLREAFEVNPTRRIPTGAIAAYLDMQNMPTTSAVPDEWVLRACGSGMKFQNGDTLMARITPCLENGKTAYVNFLKDSEVGWGSTEYIVLRSRPHLPPEYSYFLARDEDFRSFAIANMTGSSGRQRVPATAFDKYLIVVPDAKVAAAFGDFARGVLERVRMNSEESRKLAATRDALLPTLLSGEVRLRASGDEGRVVREAERAIDESLQATGQPLRAAQRAAARVKGSE